MPHTPQIGGSLSVKSVLRPLIWINVVRIVKRRVNYWYKNLCLFIIVLVQRNLRDYVRRSRDKILISGPEFPYPVFYWSRNASICGHLIFPQGLIPARHILLIQALQSLEWYSERDLNPHPEGLVPKTSVSAIPPSEPMDGCVPLL